MVEQRAPASGEEQQRKALKREAKAAAEACRFTLSDDGNGQCHGRSTVPSAVGAMLRKAVLAIAAPKHHASQGLQRLDLPGPQRLGQAFCEYAERHPAEQLPNAGGVNAGVVVTMTLETLIGGEQVATLDTGTLTSADEARRFHTPTQRTAIGLRDKTCTEAGCDWAPAMCHVHHDEPWSKGGPTSVENGRLLWLRHHSYAHNPE